ncbi:MAG: SsrA-binding protein SmpB [Chloroflexi bacterium]|nr:SsrA-binding protein SmpB [Chloroflexota bacterium]MDA1228609.1 SsrA-binding protein SmpB [Chloroflexota bacterium]
MTTQPKGNGAIVTNRRARYNYDISDTVEAGLVLLGTEIKAIREGRVNLSDSYAKPEKGELWLMNVHIAQYSAGSRNNHEPTRPRKLLLHRKQVVELSRQVSERGLTLVPLRLYIRRHVAKVELGVAKGRKLYDKRQVIVEKVREREAQEAIGRVRT